MPIDIMLSISETYYEHDRAGVEQYQYYGLFTTKEFLDSAYSRLKIENNIGEDEVIKYKEFCLNEVKYFYLECYDYGITSIRQSN